MSHLPMLSMPIAAVMVHVPCVTEALAWYTLAFPDATPVPTSIPEFGCLIIGGVSLEIVRCDAKVASGACGSVVYWHVPHFETALRHFQELGAQLYRGPINIENGEAMCQVRDPWGNCIGLRGHTHSSPSQPQDSGA